jgi:phosphatidylserine decarboxylase
MGGQCQRISIFLSVIDVHVQNAPVGGTVAFFKYTTGQFLNALKAASAIHNENVLLGFDANDPPGQKIGVRLIAGVLARRIVPFVKAGEEVVRGQRISLIQFGSRADVYLPAGQIQVKLGDHVGRRKNDSCHIRTFVSCMNMSATVSGRVLKWLSCCCG